MLAYDSYSKSIIGTVVEQKIRLFLNIRRIVNLPVFETVPSTTPIANQIVNKLFDLFVLELKDQGAYYEFAFCSIFINSPDYDFVTNDESVSLQKAEESLRLAFVQIASTEKLFNEASSPDAFNNPDLLFNFLKDKKYQREIPKFSRKLFLGSQTDTFIKGKIGGIKSKDWLGTDILKASSNEKTISELMKNDSPFYVDFFYRKKPNVKIADNDKEYRYSYIGEGDGYEGKIQFQTNKDFAYRGARIMFNLTSAITANTTEPDVFGKIKYFPLNPSRFLPYSLNLLNILDVQNPSKARTYVEKFPLPFLSNYQNTKLTNTDPSSPSNRLADSAGLGEPTFLSSVVFKLQFGTNPDNLFDAGSPHFLSGRTKSKYEVDSNYFLALRKALGNVLNWDYLMWSKSLVCFEVLASIEQSIPSDEFLFCYFPIIVAEFVDETNTLSDDQIVEKLIQTQEAKFLQNSIDFEELNKKKSSPVDIIVVNEENLKNIKTNYKTTISIGGATQQINTFEQLDSVSKELNNTLSNLINLDGEQ
tara:strand:- start:1937 stop:3532 length:1596 start_codon:yes stop_codon:yes gene_type:complete